MAQYQITVDGNAIQGLLTRDDGLARLVELVVNQILEAKLTEQLKAAAYERTEERQGYRNGHRDKTITTRIGRLVFSVPRTRNGSLSTEVFERYQRSEQSVMIATGSNRDGYREVLGLKVGDSESEGSWSDFFGWLKGRGLRGVDLVVSEAMENQPRSARWHNNEGRAKHAA